MCAGILGYQLIGANTLLEGMAVAGIAEGDDDEFIQGVLEAAQDVYEGHATMLGAVQKTRDQDLIAMNTVMIGEGAKPRADFHQLLEEFTVIKERLSTR